MQDGEILIVDDDQDIREVLASLLEWHGHTVITACDGADALAVLRAAATCPRMILLDLRMPVMNGWQFLEELGRLPRCSNVPVVVITADRSAASRAPSGTAGLLLKPLDVQAVLSAVDQYA